MKRLLFIGFLGMCAMVGGALATAIPLRLINPAWAQVHYGKPISATTSTSNFFGDNNPFEQVATKVAPAVVSVESTYPAAETQTVSAANQKKMIEESGSGFLVQFDGQSGYYVVTNNHVVANAKPQQITIRLDDGKILRPTRTWTDPETDVAVLGLASEDGPLPTVNLGNSDKSRVGQWVLAIGSPFGLNQTVTHGIISARGRGQVSLGNTIRIKDFLQTDAAINPGSSGGPLVNLQGEVIGINTAIASHSGTNSGVAFAIPIDLVKRVALQLLKNGVVPRGYLGMQLSKSFEADDALKLGLTRVQGAWVERVYPNTPAATAGLRVNDVVIQVESVVIRDENHLINLVSNLPAGQPIRLRVWRGRNMVTLNAVIGDWNKAQTRFQIP